MNRPHQALFVAGLAMALASGVSLAQIAPPVPDAASSTMNKDVLTPKDKMAFLDLNKDGLISRKEADNSLLIDWKSWDTNNDGVIDANEFVAGSKMKPKGE